MASSLASRIAKAFGFGTPAPSPATHPLAGIEKAAQTISGAPRFGFTGYNFSYTPHEPFSGAWQRNITAANPRDPNLLAFSGVYACVTIIMQDIAKMALRAMKVASDGVTEEVNTASPYHRLLRKPNRYQTSIQFMMLWIAARLLRGNNYVYQEFDARGVPKGWHWLHPDRTLALVDPETKEIYYEYTPHHTDLFSVIGFEMNGKWRIPGRFVIHDRINCLWHPLIGTSPLFAAAVTAMTGGRMLMSTERLFANMARPSGILSGPGEIHDTTAERLKREFEANYSEGNLGRTAVLGDGLEWKAMVMTSTDAQLIEQLKWTIEDVARCFRVPMYLLADITRMTYKNSEQASQSYYSGCLQYHVEDIELLLTQTFGMDEATEYVSFDVRSMFRMDMNERFTAYKSGIAAGVLAPNEARRWEGLGPVKGGEEPRMQMQYVPLSTPVADPTAPKPTPNDDPPPEDDEDDEDDDTTSDEEEASAAVEMLRIMQRVSAGAARARLAFEEREYENRSTG